jgi:type IV pilus assembly protein PilW
MTRIATPGFSLERRGARWARGFTLVELMIAVAIALFLIGGILTLVQSTRNAFATQTALAQFQDNQRLTMTFMAEVIESAGYFPSPQTYTVGAVLPPTVPPPPAAPFTVTGQGVSGTVGDTITVRFGAALNDNVFGCNGAQNLAVNPYDVFISTFFVDAVNQQLVCTATNAAGTSTVILVNQVTSLQAVYGVKRSPADTGSCTDTYLSTAQMLATDWPNVCSVTVTVTFVNPTSNTAAPVTITRVIAVMNAAGVNS